MEPQVQAKEKNGLQILFDRFSDPEYLASQYEEEGNVNILFINPTLSGNNFYKLIIPAIMMKNLDGVCTAITGIQRFNINAPFTAKDDHELTSRQILWADIIVFPFSIEPLHTTYQSIRNINPEAKIFYNVDFNCFETPQAHPYKKIFTDEKLATIDTNIINSDVVITANESMVHFLNRRIAGLVRQYKLSYTPEVRIISLIADTQIMKGIPTVGELDETTKPTKKKYSTKLLIIVTENDLTDLQAWKSQLMELEKLPIEIVVFGVNKNSEQLKLIMSGIKYTNISPVSLLTYYDTLKNIDADLVLNVTQKNRFNEMSTDDKKYIDVSVFNIPVISMPVYPYSKIIIQEKTGFLIQKQEELAPLVVKILGDLNLLTPIRQNIQTFFDSNFTDDERYYRNIFEVFRV